MKKIGTLIMRIIVMAVFFVITIFLVDKFQNRQYKNLAMEMENATLPLVYVDYEGRYINCLHGYTTVVDTTLFRDCITPVTDDKKVRLAVDDKNGYAKDYSYELRSISGDSLIENGDLESDGEENGYQMFDIEIRMDIKPDIEYMLVFKLDGKDEETVRYYTRIVINDNYHADELLDFVQKFNAATFEFDTYEEASLIYPYMQAYKGQDDDSVSMGHMNLNSSYKDLIWSGMNPIRITSIIPQIKEIDVNYAVIELDYVTMTEDSNGETDYYSIREYYRVSYKELQPDDTTVGAETGDMTGAGAEDSTGDTGSGDGEASADEGTISVMNFDRYVDEYFNRTGVDNKNNVYEIGIVLDKKLDYKYSSDNKKIAFVRNGQLWLYNYSENQISMVFGFWMDDVENVRNTYDHYDINIISMDDDGNIKFAVYGYMNRGAHEGKLGISLCSYDAATMEVTELVFAECNEPYAAMKDEVSRLTYYDGTNFYFMLGNKVNCINVDQKQLSYFIDQVSLDHVYVSDNMEVIAYDSSDNSTDNSVLTMVNLKTGQTYTFDSGAGKSLICYGFKNSDMIYGICDVADNSMQLDQESFAKAGLAESVYSKIPSYKLFIVDENGEQIKEYEKGDTYIVDVRIEDNLIYMTRGVKSGENFKQTDDDFITFKEDDAVARIQIATRSSSSGISKLYFTVPSNIYLTYVPYLNITKNTVTNRSSDMLITVEDEYAGYMVYDNLGLTGIYDKAGDAINRATKISGIVVSKDGEVVYRQSETQEYNTIASSIYHQSSKSVEASIWDCVYMTLIYEGVTDLTYDEMKASYTDPVETLTVLGKYPGADISGISLDLVFGYIGRGIPVISRINDGRYVLIVSYNSEAVRYYDPVLDEEVRVSRKEYEASMSKGNNELYSYVQE